MRSKSQSGMNAAVLIAIIAALIIVYIIFLPSEDRLEIIGDNNSDHGGNGNGEEHTIIEETEIIMEVIDDDEVEHELPSVNLYTSTEAEELWQENTIYVKNGVFDKEDQTIEFAIDDPDNTDNVLISFDAKKSQGRLILKLNNKEIFNNEIDKVNVDPIVVSSDFLSKDNTLTFSASGVGIAFWSTNEFLLENFKVTGDVTDLSTRASTLKFVLPKSESSNIEESKLRFIPECQPERSGILDISLNNNRIYSSVPDCGEVEQLEFAPSNLITGENKITFGSDRGRYLIDRIKITTKLKEQPSFTYFFDIGKEDYDDLFNDQKQVNLTFLFTDDIEDKEAEIIINSGKTFMTRHDEFTWSKDITRYVEEGTNSLKIIPKERLEIRKLLVTIEDKDDE